MSTRYAVRSFVFLGVSLGLLMAAAQRVGAQNNMCTTGMCVLTWQYDNHRSDQNLNESTLQPGTLSSFGQLCGLQLDGQVYAQPLVVTNVPINNGVYNVAYVVTQNDTLYAINASTGTAFCTVLKSQNLASLLGQYPADCQHIGNTTCSPIAPYVGILG